MEQPQKSVIIVAGGTGTRMGTTIPKQFLELGGKPILMHTLEKFFNYDHTIQLIVVLPANQHEIWQNLCLQHHFNISHILAKGGENRFDSVKSGLAFAIQRGTIAVHDGVRPLVSTETIQRCFNATKSSSAAIPVIPVTESVRLVEGLKSTPVDRTKYVLIQTPQVFDAQILHKAYQQPFSELFTDDATVVEKMGVSISLVEGNFENIKITRPIDLIVAESLQKG